MIFLTPPPDSSSSSSSSSNKAKEKESKEDLSKGRPQKTYDSHKCGLEFIFSDNNDKVVESCLELLWNYCWLQNSKATHNKHTLKENKTSSQQNTIQKNSSQKS